MGKNSAINSLGRCIGNVVLHKLLLKHTNKPESKKHLRDEIVDYSADASDNAKDFSFSEQEKIEIKDKAIRRVKNTIEKYPDIIYEEREIAELTDKTMKELAL